ncbi:stationary phase inducible protein CsiE [Pantoea sp. A4]|uniref:stationary phase inducible protein CsiE n=1 Tax=Pantoea sp. A4 TaxID=1225184 RepID=UPI000377F1C9|nr:stationary phase inducible protein CsiE [Pantoea sp. A4]
MSASPLFTRSQRRCHLLLLLFLPAPVLTPEKLCQINRVDTGVAREDIVAVGEEIQRFYQLELHQMVDGSLRIHGTELNRRICLIHALRRALRLSREFVCQAFSTPLRQRLKLLKVEKALYDDTNLQALIHHCELRLGREFNERDQVFLQLYFKFVLCQRHTPLFSAAQQQWLAQKPERNAAEDVVRHWQKRSHLVPGEGETDFGTLLFALMHAPGPDSLQHPCGVRLRQAVTRLIAHFEQEAGTLFKQRGELRQQLYTHLAQALDRSYFAIGIDNSVALDVAQLYPRLLRTTQVALQAFEAGYQVTLSEEEVSLVAVIFGAWLMQDNALQEKQVLLLTHEDAEAERALERQIRDITLLPFTLRYQDLGDFQQQGAPDEIDLVVTPYMTSLPLYSPPLILAQVPLTDEQQMHIRQLLDSGYARS